MVWIVGIALAVGPLLFFLAILMFTSVRVEGGTSTRRTTVTPSEVGSGNGWNAQAHLENHASALLDTRPASASGGRKAEVFIRAREHFQLFPNSTRSSLVVTAPGDVVIVRIPDGTHATLRIGTGREELISGAGWFGAARATGAIVVASETGLASVWVAVANPLTLAVLPFTGSDAGAAAAAGDAISVRMAQTGAFRVIERIQIDKVMNNLALENTEFFDPKTAGKIGKLLGVASVVSGSMQVAAGQVRLSARRLDAETGETLASQSVEGAESSLFPLQDELADKLATAIISAECDRAFTK